MAQEFRHVNRRGVQCEVFLRLAGALDPVNVVVCALFEKRLHLITQLVQPPVAFNQFLPDVLVLACLDEIAHRFPQPLDGQCDIVLHQFGAANTEFRPVP